MQQQGGLTVRRLIFPLIIVGVAIALGVWTSQLGGANSKTVERFVKQLCMEISAGSDAEILLARSDALVAAGVRQQIAAIAAAQGGQIERIDVDVIAGDLQPYPGSATATHSALVGDGNVQLLGMRVQCSDDTSGVRIIGYWVPQGD